MKELTQQDQYQLMKGWLNERQWRLYVATEARRMGVGGISQVAREAGVSYQPGERIRKEDGGRKKSTDKDATLQADLEAMLEPKGDPQSLVRWTTKSVSKLKAALSSQGHTIADTAVRGMLREMGFSLKANKKSIEGTGHADRDLQFQHINRTCKAFAAKVKPAVSVDCKKKELIGNAQEQREGMASQRTGHAVSTCMIISLLRMGKLSRMASMTWHTTAVSSMWASTMRQ